MQLLNHIHHLIHNFIFVGQKFESTAAVGTAAGVGFISSNRNDLVQELFWRDVNSLIVAAVSAIVIFFVTKLLKKKFDKNKIDE